MVYEQFKQLDAVKHDRTIKSLIGVSRTHFDTLARAFAVAYDTVQLERLQQGEIKQVPSGGRKGSLDTFDKKLFFGSLPFCVERVIGCPRERRD